MRKERLYHQATIHDIADDLKESDLYYNTNLLVCPYRSIKIVKDNKGKRKLIGFFKKQLDVNKACQATLDIKGVEYKWIRDNYKPDKKKSAGKYKRNSNSLKNSDKKKSKKNLLLNKKNKKNKYGGKQDSIADVLVKKALSKILEGHTKSKSRKEKQEIPLQILPKSSLNKETTGSGNFYDCGYMYFLLLTNSIKEPSNPDQVNFDLTEEVKILR
ncbi:hypothetical protein C1645_744531 [Glomus cerebriforme]|uniref:Uncharacterized protein n=1 Tax=Glomus cerebriforme TaxID=658196 RepID=A0A397S9B8_9GLOM|nr:hypothetical protein C1645_744531 [Glomus cerebriforme]